MIPAVGGSSFANMLLILLVALGAPARAEICGQLAGVKGSEVEILRRQARAAENVRFAMKIPEQKITPVECDDVILTGADSSARLILANAKVTVGPLTRFEIAGVSKANGGREPSVSLLDLTYGKVRALVNRKEGQLVNPPAAETNAGTTGAQKPIGAKASQSTFRIRTYTAVVGVRGTDFFVGFDPNSGALEQATIEGQVEVAKPDTTAGVLVSGGQQTTVSANAAPAAPIALRDSTRNEIRVVSASAREDKDFTHPKAIEVLGQPSTWVLEREKLPDHLKNLKDEF